MARETKVGLQTPLILVGEELREQDRVVITPSHGPPQNALDRRKDISVAVLLGSSASKETHSSLAAQVVLDLAHHVFDADRWFSDHWLSHGGPEETRLLIAACR
jgi:hypothetical protein